MIYAHLSGYLVRTPESKTSSKGTSYGKALLLVAVGEGEQLVNLTVFDDDLQTLLANLAKGDSISAMGSLSVRPWKDKQGELQAGLSMVVNRIMTLADQQAKPRPRADTTKPRREAGYQSAGPREFAPIDDDF